MKHTDIVDGVWTLPVEDKDREKGHIGEVRLPPLALAGDRRHAGVREQPLCVPGGPGTAR